VKRLLILEILLVVSLIGLMIVGCSKPSSICGDQVCGTDEQSSSTCLSDCLASYTGKVILVNPSAVSIANGNDVTLEVRVANVESLVGFQFDVTYDPQILEFVGAYEGTVLNSDGQSTFCMNGTAENGYVKNILCIRFGSTGVAGNGVLERLAFKGIAIGESDIILSNVKIVDSSTNEILVTVGNGTTVVK
jgi:hypothetical protein